MKKVQIFDNYHRINGNKSVKSGESSSPMPRTLEPRTSPFGLLQLSHTFVRLPNLPLHVWQPRRLILGLLLLRWQQVGKHEGYEAVLRRSVGAEGSGHPPFWLFSTGVWRVSGKGAWFDLETCVRAGHQPAAQCRGWQRGASYVRLAQPTAWRELDAWMQISDWQRCTSSLEWPTPKYGPAQPPLATAPLTAAQAHHPHQGQWHQKGWEINRREIFTQTEKKEYGCQLAWKS